MVDSIREQLNNNDLSVEERQEVETALQDLVDAKEAYDGAETDEEKEIAEEQFEEAQESVPEPSQESNDGNSEEENSGNDLVKNYISYSDGMYYHGDTINLSYDSSLEQEQLEFFGAEEGAKIAWDLYANETDVQVTQIVGQGKKVNYKLMRTADEFYIGVQYWNNPDDYPNEENKKELRIKVIIINSQEFSFEEMYASDANYIDKSTGLSTRSAKSGETLYLVKATGITNDSDRRRSVNYSITTTPNLVANSYNINDIEWNYSNTNGTRQYDYGKINISRSLWERDLAHTTSAEVGFPDKKTKSIDVQFVDGNISPYEVGLPKSINKLKEVFSEIQNNIEAFNTIPQKLGIDKPLEFEIQPIKIEGKTYNKEDSKSRLYLIRNEMKITGGIEAELAKLQLTLPPLKVLSTAGIANIGLYALLKFGIKIEGGEEKEKLFNSDQYIVDDIVIALGASGCVEAGLETELLLAKDQLNFNVKGFVEGCLAGEAKYNFTQESFYGKIFLPPVVLGAEVDISTKGVLDFDLVNYKKSIEITEEKQLWPKI